MTTVKRAYVYLVALISLAMFSVGLVRLIEVLLEPVLPGSAGFTPPDSSAFRQNVAFYGAILLVGLPVWVGHWSASNRWTRPSSATAVAERTSVLRNLYLYGLLAITMLTALYTASGAATAVFDLLLGRATFRPTALSEPAIRLFVALVLWRYHWSVLVFERALTAETGAGATIRRLYGYGVSFVALVTFVDNAVLLASVVWQSWFDASRAVAFRDLVAPFSGGTLAALGVWLGHYRWTSDWVGDHGRQAPLSARKLAESGQTFVSAKAPVDDRSSTLRSVYLFAAVGLTVAGTLYFSSQALFVLFRALLGPGDTPGPTPLVIALGRPISGSAVFGPLWIWHWLVVQREAANQVEAPRQATLRRLYHYVVALVGATMLVVAAAGSLRLLVDLLDASATNIGLTSWQDQLALYLALAIVGLSAWLYHWLRAQRLASRPGILGSAERGSLSRRLYLYLGVLAGVLTLLFQGSTLLYALLKLALGEPPGGHPWSDLARAISDSVVLGLVLVYHWRTLAADAAWPEEHPTLALPDIPALETEIPVAEAPTACVLAIITGPQREAIEALLAQLAGSLPSGSGLQIRWTELAESTIPKVLRPDRGRGGPSTRLS
ncbi:MAG: hypothetical protein HY329_11395 [Chloroflexi bacterium]|nr:hypothetical protein [Chloroflexota bacterium]